MTAPSGKNCPSRTADKFVVRLPDGMRERLRDVAKGNHRAMNSEIIARLERTLVMDGQCEEQANQPIDLNGMWIPQIGQVVITPNGPSHIEDFTVDRDGTVYAFCPSVSKSYPLDKLKPFALMR